MKETNDNSSNSLEKKPFASLLGAKRVIDGKEKTIFYIIPTSQEKKFLANLELIDTSLNAKEIYRIDTTLYNSNIEKYYSEVENIFDNLVPIMGVITDS